jgi:2-methylcitrate dehydratase PrpD
MSAAAALGEFVAALRWSDVDSSLHRKIKAHVLDTLGVMCAGVATAEADAMGTVVRHWGGIEEATVVARGWRIPAPHAAFLNAFHARLHTFDDTYEAGPLHPGSAAVSAALAAAETNDASGAEFLAGVLAGYEVAVRVSAALGPSHYAAGFHNTGTCNAFGACAAAARIFALDATATAEAFGLAGEAAAGLRQYQVDGSMADSALGAARAAQTGVTSVELQRAGLAGPRGILDGPWGICRVMSAQPDLERLERGLGSSYVFAATALKPYPSCRFTHGPIEVLLALRRREGFDPNDVAAVEIATFRESISVSDQPEIRSRLHAILSHQYNAALALIDGRVTLESFDAERISDPALLALAERVRVVFDPALEEAYPSKWPHRVSVTLTDGRRFDALSDHPPGGRDAPITWDQVAEKFVALAVSRLGADAAQRTVAIVASLDERSKVTDLTRELRGLAVGPL